jgi:hypothetical protein
MAIKEFTSQIELDRIYEIKFYELCSRLFNFRQNPEDITQYLKTIVGFMPECPLGPIIELKNEIFQRKYKPSKQEVMLTLYYDKVPPTQIATKVNVGAQTLYNNLRTENMLYPRASEHMILALRKFIPEYIRLLEINYMEVI